MLQVTLASSNNLHTEAGQNLQNTVTLKGQMANPFPIQYLFLFRLTQILKIK